MIYHQNFGFFKLLHFVDATFSDDFLSARSVLLELILSHNPNIQPDIEQLFNIYMHRRSIG